MKNTIKIMIFSLIMIALLCIPSISNAAETETATDESTLISAIENVDDGGTVEIQNNITVTQPIVIQKELTIDGNGYTISGSTDWTSTSGNQTMFTAQLAAGKLTLKDIDLNNGPKYGVQSYDGATVILNNVSITGFRYGGVLVNGGYLEIINLHLGTNGTGANNGIEIDKGSSATNNPTLVMNGTLTSDFTENVIRIADNGYLTEFIISNTESTINKVVIAGDSLVLIDENNNVISQTEIPENITYSTNESKKIIITLIVGGEVASQITINEGTTVTEDELKSHITVEEGYEVEGFYTDETYTNKLDFNTALSSDIIIYARIEEITQEEIDDKNDVENTIGTTDEKDDVPKTGVANYLGIAILAVAVAFVGVIYLKKKNLIS